MTSRGSRASIRLVFITVSFLYSILYINILKLRVNKRHDPFNAYLVTSTHRLRNVLETRDKRGNHLYRCSLKPARENPLPWRRKRLSTVITFQSNSGSQLQNFMTHYTPVIGHESIVIIDHVTTGREVDPSTAHLLDKYRKLGSDLWRCDGSFLYKAEMWSDVINQYTDLSEFVFPLDIDEFVSVLNNDETLSWNHNDFSKALLELEDTGKPFKMEGGVVFPSDCGNLTWPEISRSSSLLKEIDPPLRARYAARRNGRTLTCMDKVFMRSKDFEATDGGNHLGKTRNFAMQLCPNAPEPDQRSRIFLIHMQQNNFEEWMLHGLRGAAARGYNKINSLTKCVEGMVSGHYCAFWKQIVGVKFDPWSMKMIYMESVCKSMVENDDPISLPKEMH